MSSFYLTTPIYYVNGLPHLGHAYTTIVADTMNRFQKRMGKDAIFITGTDEHGDKIVQAAEKAGEPVDAFTNRMSGEFQALWPRLEIYPDRFMRTTSKEHKAVVQSFLQRVYDAGDIYFGEYGGHYCLGCERFYTEKELENGLCPQHQAKPEYISEKNYFFRMGKYQKWLKQYILDHPDFIRPEQYRLETLALLDSGELDDLCISRPKSRLTWGIELPFDENYVCYVWFDALLTYLSALGGPGTADFERYWPVSQHLVAKDILKPHAIFWPTMLRSAGLPLYRHLNVHGYWLVRDVKMSKSLGNVVEPLTMAQQFGVDVFRYFLLRDMHFGSDGSFSEDALVSRFNADLANDLGNLFSRVLSMGAKYCEGLVPQPGPVTELEGEVRELAQKCLSAFQAAFDGFRFSVGLEALWELVRGLNKYVDASAPWALAKNKDFERLGTVLYTLLETMRKVALHLWPVMPEKASQMLDQLGVPLHTSTMTLAEEIDQFGVLRPGTAIAATSSLFPRIERPLPEVPATKPQGSKKQQKSSSAAHANPIDFTLFQQIDLRLGTIVACEAHPNADKLLRLSVDAGEEKPRQIVSAIAEWYNPDDLINRQVVFVANLAPRKIRGLESQGMILTVESEGQLELVSIFGSLPAGTQVR